MKQQAKSAALHFLSAFSQGWTVKVTEKAGTCLIEATFSRSTFHFRGESWQMALVNLLESVRSWKQGWKDPKENPFIHVRAGRSANV